MAMGITVVDPQLGHVIEEGRRRIASRASRFSQPRCPAGPGIFARMPPPRASAHGRIAVDRPLTQYAAGAVPPDGAHVIAMASIALVAVLGECFDLNDAPVDKSDGNQQLLRPTVVGPGFDGNCCADRVRLTDPAAADSFGGCAYLDAVLHHGRAAAIRPHGRHGIADHNELVAATHVRPRVTGSNETKNSEERNSGYPRSHGEMLRSRVEQASQRLLAEVLPGPFEAMTLDVGHRV